MAEEEKPVGLGGSEIKGDGAGLLGVPLGQGNVGLGRLKGDRIESGDILATEDQVTVDLHLRISLLGQAGQLQFEVIILVDHLQRKEKSKWRQPDIASSPTPSSAIVSSIQSELPDRWRSTGPLRWVDWNSAQSKVRIAGLNANRLKGPPVWHHLGGCFSQLERGLA